MYTCNWVIIFNFYYGSYICLWLRKRSLMFLHILLSMFFWWYLLCSGMTACSFSHRDPQLSNCSFIGRSRLADTKHKFVEKLLYKCKSAILQYVLNWLLKIVVVYVESLQCCEVNDVSLNQLTVRFGEVKGVDLECFVTSHKGTLYSRLRNGKIRKPW